MKLRSPTNFIALGLASLTLSLVLMAHSLGIVPDDAKALLQARVQTAELVAAQCSPAAAAGDVTTMSAILRQVAARNTDLTSAGIRDAAGKLVYSYGPHDKSWGTEGKSGSSSLMVKLSVPIATEKGDWGRVEFCFARDGASIPSFLPEIVRSILGNSSFRIGVFVAVAGFICYSLYLRRTLKHLDPSAVIPPRVRSMLDALAEGIIVLDKDGRIVMANESFSQSTGLPLEKLPGRKAHRLAWTLPHSDEATTVIPWTTVLQSGQAVKAAPLAMRVKAGAQPAAGDKSQDGTDAAPQDSQQGVRRIFSVNAAPVLGPDGKVRGALATFDDVTSMERRNTQLRRMLQMLKKSRDEINQKNQELQTLATTDSLTGCLNRRAFFSIFDGHWSAAQRHHHTLAVAMLDVDHFKKINDRHGHAVGDQVLQHVAARLKELSRNSDVVCRYGGEEFCILLPHTDLAGAAQTADRFRRAIEADNCGGVPVTASFGVSAIGAGAISPPELLNQADQALYAAKRSGRNRVEGWSSAIAAAAPPERAEPARPAQGTGDPIPFGAVAALLSALTHRDRRTAEHSRRVADLSVAAAQGIMSVSDCFTLETAALLHDIGKLAVPDAILLKPGPLTEDEWKIMRVHDRMGAEIVAAAFNSPQLTEIVRSHHYFYGKAKHDPNDPMGHDIPVGSRILTIVDAYDAMVNDRPYRKARSQAEAFAELRRCAGSQFDPELVERVINAITGQSSEHSDQPVVELFSAVQRDLDRLVAVLESQDLALFAAMAARFSAKAAVDGLESVSSAARELQMAASDHPDVVAVAKRLNELIDLCKSADAVRPARSMALAD